MKVQSFLIDNSHLYCHQPKWGGYNGKWMVHVRKVVYEITWQGNEVREDSRRVPTMNHALLFFSTIHLERISNKTQLATNKRTQVFPRTHKADKTKRLTSKIPRVCRYRIHIIYLQVSLTPNRKTMNNRICMINRI